MLSQLSQEGGWCPPPYDGGDFWRDQQVPGRLLWASHSTLTSPCCSPVGRTVWPGFGPCRPWPVWCATRATCSLPGTAPSPPQGTTSPPVATTGLPGCGPRTRASHSGSSTVISLTWTAWHSIQTLTMWALDPRTGASGCGTAWRGTACTYMVQKKIKLPLLVWRKMIACLPPTNLRSLHCHP